MRVVAWNIRAGGGVRVDAIARQLHRWRADVVALSEFRATPPSARLAALLAAQGLTFQASSADPAIPGLNALLVASRWPLRRVHLRGAPDERCRWLLATIAAPERFALGAMHVPNRVSGRKFPFLDAVLGCVHRWSRGPALLVGDTNSGRRIIDEEVPAFNDIEEGWIDALAALGWTDAFRFVHGERRAYTWYSPNGRNGFRIDQAFVNDALLPRLKRAAYVWGRAARNGSREALSDHAALIVDLRSGGPRHGPPHPPALGTAPGHPGRSSRLPGDQGGPDMAPTPPSARHRPGPPGAAPRDFPATRRAPTWPPTPPSARQRPGPPGAVLETTRRPGGSPDERRNAWTIPC
jgi:exodeoxyribonuclease-3